MFFRRLRDISKKTSFFRYVRPRRFKDVTQNTSFLRYTRDVLKTSQKSPLFRYVSKRSLRCLSKWRSDWDISDTSHAGSEWNFHLISITAQNWTGLWTPAPTLLLLHQIYCFRLQTSLICKKEKKNIMWEVAARRCSAKTPYWKFHKIYREIPGLESSFWRSNHPEVFCKKEVLENFAKLWHRCFLWILRNFSEHLVLQNISRGCFCF